MGDEWTDEEDTEEERQSSLETEKMGDRNNYKTRLKDRQRYREYGR